MTPMNASGTSPDPFETAVSAHEAGDFETAERIYRSILDTDPDDAVVQELLGTALAARGRHDEARTHLERSLQLDPNSATAHYAIAELLIAQGDSNGAEQSLNACLMLDSGMRPALLRLGMLLVDRRRCEEADHVVERLTALDSGSADAQLIRAGIALARNRYQHTLELLDDLPEPLRSDSTVRFFEVLSLVRLDRLDAATRVIKSIPPTLIAAMEYDVGTWLAANGHVKDAAAWCILRRNIGVSDPTPQVVSRLAQTVPDRVPELKTEIAKLRFGAAAGDVLAGLASVEAGDFSTAATRLGRAVAIRSDDPDLLATCAATFTRVGRASEAVALLEANQDRHGQHTGMLCERAHALFCLGREQDALSLARIAHDSDAKAEAPLRMLIQIAVGRGEFEDCLRWCDGLRDLVGHDACPIEAAESLAGSMRPLEALDRLRSHPDFNRDRTIARQHLYLSNFRDDIADATLADWHKEFGVSVNPSSGARTEADRRLALGRSLNSGTRIRIAFLSPDYRRHSVWYFIEPMLTSLDRRRFDVVGISDAIYRDSVTDRIRRCCDEWVDVGGESSDSFLDRISRLELDMIVEMSGHTFGSRLVELAERVAPVQMTWLGYPNTTGVDAIDFRIVDEITDPRGTEHLATETLLRMPRCFLCHMAPPELPDPDASHRAGGPIFGSFNNLAKITDTTISAWSAVLREIPSSRMLIKSKSLREASTAARLRSRFEAAGIAADRLVLRPWVNDPEGHLAAYREVDVALDTFPYNGTTTTCEALSMGVPVVSLVGDSHRSRVGMSILSAAGRSEWAVRDVDAFVATSISLSARRNEPRTDLLEGTPLRDSAGFATSFMTMLERAAVL